jgi:hypothetical protein
MALNQVMQALSLALNAGLPIWEDQVVIRGELVVKGLVHTAIITATFASINCAA